MYLTYALKLECYISSPVIKTYTKKIKKQNIKLLISDNEISPTYNHSTHQSSSDPIKSLYPSPQQLSLLISANEISLCNNMVFLPHNQELLQQKSRAFYELHLSITMPPVYEMTQVNLRYPAVFSDERRLSPTTIQKDSLVESHSQ